MVAELSKLLVMIMVISLAFQTTSGKPPVNQLEPSMTNSINTAGEDDQLLAVHALGPQPRSEYVAPKYFGSSPSADEAFAPELLGDEFLSPEYPSPAPAYDHELSPPYVAVMAPEIADGDEFYSSAPTPTPATTVAAPDIDYGNVAPTPLLNVLPFTYEAEDKVPEIDEEELQGEFSHKKKGTVLGFVVFAVCLVGLGGFVYKKRKDHDMRKSQYEYLGKRELEL